MKYKVSFYAWKHDIFTSESNMLSSPVERSLLLWLHNKSHPLVAKKIIQVKWFVISLVII